MPFRGLWNPKGAARALLDQLEGGLGDISAQLGGHGSDFLTIFEENYDFLISAPLSSGMRVFGGSRGQVGAVWAPKGRLEAVWAVKIATDRVGRAVGTAKSRQNLAGRFGLAVGVMETIGTNTGIKSIQSPKSI